MADHLGVTDHSRVVSLSPSEVFDLANSLYEKEDFKIAAETYAELVGLQSSAREHEHSMLRLVQCYIALGDLKQAQIWADDAMAQPIPQAEPAYYMCKALREKEEYGLAYHYYLLAARVPKPAPNDYFEEPVYDYLLEYEKSIMWYYVGALSDRFTLRHGLALCMRLLENPSLPSALANVVYNNLPVYAQALRGEVTRLRGEKGHDDPWRFSSPTFVGNSVLIREVNYYAAEDGTYHVSGANQVNTRLLVDGSNHFVTVQESEDFQRRLLQEDWHHPEAYVQGLEDTRVAVSHAPNTNATVVYTLSASMEYTRNMQHMNQVLGILDLDEWTLTIQGIISGPYGERTDKNWVFAEGLNQIIYHWYPSIEIGHIDIDKAELILDRSLPSPRSFWEMRGSTNGVLYNEEWWFVTHMVKHRSGQRRLYTHRIVVLNRGLTAVTRYTLPFTFHSNADIEYCLGLQVDAQGVTFGYSVRDHSSWTMKTDWCEITQLFSV